MAVGRDGEGWLLADRCRLYSTVAGELQISAANAPLRTSHGKQLAGSPAEHMSMPIHVWCSKPIFVFGSPELSKLLRPLLAEADFIL